MARSVAGMDISDAVAKVIESCNLTGNLTGPRRRDDHIRLPRRARQHGRARCTGAGAVGRPDAARNPEFPAERATHAARRSSARSDSSSMRRRARTRELGDLPAPIAAAIQAAALEVAAGLHDDQFPVDVFQTGSGTSSNMNANEVIATLAARRLGEQGASERSGEHGPEQQRRRADGDPRVRRSGAQRALAARLAAPFDRARVARARVRGDGQNRPHAFDGRDAHHARAGARRLACADRQGLRTAPGGDAAAARARAGRHRGGHGHQCARELRRSLRPPPRRRDAARVRAQPQLLRGTLEPGHGGGAVRASSRWWP